MKTVLLCLVLLVPFLKAKPLSKQEVGILIEANEKYLNNEIDIEAMKKAVKQAYRPKHNPKGYVTKSDFRQILKPLEEFYSDKTIDKLFDKADVDESGTLVYEEFLTTVRE